MEKRFEELLERLRDVTAQVEIITRQTREIEENLRPRRPGDGVPAETDNTVLGVWFQSVSIEEYERILNGTQAFILTPDQVPRKFSKVLIQEIDHSDLPTGRRLLREVIEVYNDPGRLKPGWCVVGLR